jgi:hypothetical protein
MKLFTVEPEEFDWIIAQKQEEQKRFDGTYSAPCSCFDVSVLFDQCPAVSVEACEDKTAAFWTYHRGRGRFLAPAFTKLMYH